MNKYQISDIKRYDVIKPLDSGGFGSVYLVKDKKTQNQYAAKVIKTSEARKKLINREIGIMSRARHPTIIRFYGYSLKDFQDSDNVTIIMEMAQNGSLEKLLKDARAGLAVHEYDNTARQKILIGIARGMMYLHKSHVIHRDLKPANVLIDDKFEPHITDFGLSKFVSTEELITQSQTAGTSIYMSPEVIDTMKYNGRSDVYSFAILMYQVVTDLEPFPEIHRKDFSAFRFYEKIIKDNYRPKLPDTIKLKIRMLIEQCWSPDPKDRPTFEDIYNKLAKNMVDSEYNVFDQEDVSYFLDDVDIDEIQSYVDSIDEEDSIEHQLIDKITELSNSNSHLKRKIARLEKQNSQLATKVQEIQSQVDQLLKNGITASQHASSSAFNQSKYADEIKVRISDMRITNLNKVNHKLPNPQIYFYIDNQFSRPFAKSQKQLSTINPVWNSETNLYIPDANHLLTIGIFHINSEEKTAECVAEAVEFPFDQLIIGSPPIKKEVDLTYDKRNAGKLYFEIQAFHTFESDIPMICTFAVSGERYIIQKEYSCITCNITHDQNRLVCESCARNCHKGHTLYLSKIGEAYCDCPSGCKCQCLPDTSKRECTSIEYNGTPLTQPMYYCKECDSSCTKLICQICAANLHHGHKLIYAGVVEKTLCQESEIP